MSLELEMADFAEWIEGKYLEWRGKSRATISAYAEYLDVPQSLLSQWMKRGGKVPKSKKHVDALIAKYGNEVYSVLDLPVPVDPLAAYPPEVRGAVTEIRQLLSSTDPADWGEPATAEAVKAILIRYGAKDIEISE